MVVGWSPHLCVSDEPAIFGRSSRKADCLNCFAPAHQTRFSSTPLFTTRRRSRKPSRPSSCVTAAPTYLLVQLPWLPLTPGHHRVMLSTLWPTHHVAITHLTYLLCCTPPRDKRLRPAGSKNRPWSRSCLSRKSLLTWRTKNSFVVSFTLNRSNAGTCSKSES